MTRFIVSVFSFRNRVSFKEAFEGLELGEGKLSRPVLRGPGGRKAARLLDKVTGQIQRSGKYGMAAQKPPCLRACNLLILGDRDSEICAAQNHMFVGNLRSALQQHCANGILLTCRNGSMKTSIDERFCLACPNSL